MVLYLLHRYLPSLDRVALFASGTKLTLVNIGMAVGTLRAHVAEHQLRVARHARHFLVHAAQGIFRLVVIKLGHAADRLPSTKRVAVLAWNIQRPVWTSRSLAPLVRRHTRGTHQRKQDQPHKESDCSKPTFPQKARKNGVALRHEFSPRTIRTTFFKK